MPQKATEGEKKAKFKKKQPKNSTTLTPKHHIIVQQHTGMYMCDNEEQKAVTAPSASAPWLLWVSPPKPRYLHPTTATWNISLCPKYCCGHRNRFYPKQAPLGVLPEVFLPPVLFHLFPFFFQILQLPLLL